MSEVKRCYCDRAQCFADEGLQPGFVCKRIDSATAELRRELEEVKRQLWGAERRVVNLETENDALKREVEGLRKALADAIRRPMGVVPESAEGLIGEKDLEAAEQRRTSTSERNE